MAGKDLDVLARELADARISRGKALKRIGVALLGGLLALGPMAAASADPPCRNVRCPGGRVCQFRPSPGEKLCECCKGGETCDPTLGCVKG